MSHLGPRVAAFVDGQLTPESADEVRRHLAECARCREAVRDQELLKRRMSHQGSAPDIPAGLAESLFGLPEVTEQTDARPRLRENRSFCAGMAVVSASFAVFLVAYLVGQHDERVGDPVAPSFDAYATTFVSETAEHRSPDVAAEFAPAGTSLTPERLDELDAQGWPCRRVLAGDLRRVTGWMPDGSETVSLRYTDGQVHLHLLQQTGSLDRSRLEGFRESTLADAQVWVRDGIPTVVTWDADGLVFTMVTDAGTDRIAQVVSDLPTSPARGLPQRVDDGLTRMSGWISAA